jgi:hypothetical protein
MDKKFVDPLNVEEIKDKFSIINDELQIFKFIESVFPSWIYQTLDSYSNDYPHLTSNWNKICSMLNTTPKKIVLVTWISRDESYKLVMYFCEVLTKRGYIVRRVDEIITCKSCNRGIPDREVWEKMKEHNIECPDKWSYICSSC